MANFTVTTLNDELDSTDPSVLLAAPGDLSLREALVLANADSSTADTITFAANVTGGTNAGIDDGMVTLTSGELTLSSNVTIDGDVNGDDKADVTISGNSASRIFHATGGTSRLDALTISGGVVSVGDGGGLLIDSGADVTVANTTIQSNAAQRGGGIFVAGLLTVIDSTVALNSAASNGGGGGGGIGAGGGIEIAFGGTSVLVNATVAENLGQRGAGIYNDGGTLSVTNSTVAGNLANKGAGGIEAFSGSSTTLTNSIVAGNQNGGLGAEVVGAFTFAGLNVIGTGSDTDPSDHKIETPNPESLFAQVAVNSRGVTSGVLADNGGPVQTIAIKQGGIAHNPADTTVPTDTTDADRDGNNTEALPIDARGEARQVGAVDIGAVELQATPENLVVTTLVDGGDDAYDNGDIVAEAADGGGLSLREALALANGNPDANTITFAANLTGGSTAGVNDGIVTLTSGELTLSSNVTIDGDVNGDDKADITISGNNASRVLHATAGTSRLDALTLTGGNAGSLDDGGGLLIDSGANVTVANTTIQSSTGLRGGGIFVAGLLTVIDSTVALNSAPSNGGGGGIGIASGGTSVLVNTMVADNLGQRGAGISNLSGTLSLTNSTVSGNRASKGAGGIEAFSGSSTTLTNSIVAGNQNGGSGAEVVGVFTFAGLNVIGTGSDTDPSDHKIETPNPESLFAQVAVNSRGVTSGVLADNGGPVQTIAIKQGGVAHDPAGTIVPTDTADADGDANTSEPLPTDARGFARVDGAHVDVGAFELQAVNDAPTFAGLDGTPSYAENGLAVVLDANATVGDPELAALNGGAGNYNGATLTLTRHSGASPDDVFGTSGTLSFSGSNVRVGATTVGTFTQTGGTLEIAFNASATQANVNAVLNQLTYRNTSDNPPASVRIDYIFTDGNAGAQGDPATPAAASGSVTVGITANNDAPVITPGNAAAYSEQMAAVLAAPDISLDDVDSANLVGATVRITDLRSGDALHFNNQNGITHTYDPATGLLTLSGSVSVANYQTALRSITFDNLSNDDPTAGGTDLSRTIAWQVDDSAVATTTVNITAVNDAPVSIDHNYTLGVDGPLTIAAAQGLLSGASDPDNDPLSALVVTGPGHGTLSLNSDGSFVYKAANTFFGEDSITFKANDGSLNSNLTTVRINVTRETSSETTTNPGGGSTTTYYDAKGDKAWSSQSHNFDSQGRETSATVSYDDGSIQGATFDANNDQPWKSQNSVTNAQGQLTNMGVIYDDGTQQVAIFDAGNNQPWLSQNAVYDALGRQTTLGVIYDDGSQQTAIFDAANNQLWSSQNMVYDVHGHLTNVGVIYDDLHTETAVFDVHSDQPWVSQSAVYDPGDSLIAASVRYDDGHVENWHI